MRLKKVRFVTEDGLKMYGLLHLPDTDTKRVVVFIHGMHSNCFKERDDVIAKKLSDMGIAYFSFNNRGAECIIKLSDRLCGSVYEKGVDCTYDINAAIKAMEELNFNEIHLLGHSLGCSKILYWYNNDKKHEVASIGLLSLTDLADKTRTVLGDEKYDGFIKMANELVSANKGKEIMPREAFTLPISAGSYLALFEKGSKMDFTNYADKNWDAKMLNSIREPIFMRYGTVYETIVQEAAEVVRIVKSKVSNDKLDVSFIEGADHSYHGKEEELASEYADFLAKM